MGDMKVSKVSSFKYTDTLDRDLVYTTGFIPTAPMSVGLGVDDRGRYLDGRRGFVLTQTRVLLC